MRPRPCKTHQDQSPLITATDADKRSPLLHHMDGHSTGKDVTGDLLKFLIGDANLFVRFLLVNGLRVIISAQSNLFYLMDIYLVLTGEVCLCRHATIIIIRIIFTDHCLNSDSRINGNGLCVIFAKAITFKSTFKIVLQGVPLKVPYQEI